MDTMSAVLSYMLIQAFIRARGREDLYEEYLHRAFGEARRILNDKIKRNSNLKHLHVRESEIPGFFPALQEEIEAWEKSGFTSTYYERQMKIIHFLPKDEQGLEKRVQEMTSVLSQAERQLLATITNESVRLYQSMVSRERMSCDM